MKRDLKHGLSSREHHTHRTGRCHALFEITFSAAGECGQRQQRGPRTASSAFVVFGITGEPVEDNDGKDDCEFC